MIETRSFGRTGLQVGALGVGAVDIGCASDQEVDRILGKALDAGVNVIDTAAMYAGSEEKLGRVLRKSRQHFLLFTKCGAYLPPRKTFAGFVARAHRKVRHLSGADEGGLPYWYEPYYWHPRVLRCNIDQSLLRLNTDRLDLIQLHTCSEETLRRGDAIDALQRARQTGKVRYIGYSGDGRAALYAIQCGQFDAIQTSINIADQEAIDLLVPLAVQRGIGVIAKRPIANGVWTHASKPEAARQHAYWERLQELQYGWLHHDGAFQTALRFTLSVSGVSTAIVGTSGVCHFQQNVAFAAAGTLEKLQFDAIRSHWKRIARPDWIGQA